MVTNPQLGTEVVQGTLRAFKVARLILHDDGGPVFEGVGLGGCYGANDVAACVEVPHHVPPHPGCSCGFYAWRRRTDAIDLVGELVPALLDVDLWGSFHEYERGYVAAVQQVRDVVLQPFCVDCLAGRKNSLRAAVVIGPSRHGDDAQLLPLCDEHSSAEDYFTTLRLTDAFGVRVRWAPDRHPLTEAAKKLILSRRPLLRRFVRRLDDLVPGEVAHVFQDSIAQAPDGQVFIDPCARLIQPLPGTDVAVRLTDDGTVEVLLDGVVDFDGWRRLDDADRFTLPLRTRGRPHPALVGTEDAEGGGVA
jgi:hypothetical protein